MGTQNHVILTEAQKNTAVGFNNGLNVMPRPVDTELELTAQNINDAAADYAPGDFVALTGKFLTPVRVLNNPDYIAENPDLVAYLSDKPFGIIEDESVFVPQIEDPI